MRYVLCPEHAISPLFLTLIALIALVVIPTGTAQAADPDELSPQADLYYTTYSVVNKSTLSTNWTNMSQIVGSCKVSTSGST